MNGTLFNRSDLRDIENFVKVIWFKSGLRLAQKNPCAEFVEATSNISRDTEWKQFNHGDLREPEYQVRVTRSKRGLALAQTSTFTESAEAMLNIS